MSTTSYHCPDFECSREQTCYSTRSRTYATTTGNGRTGQTCLKKISGGISGAALAGGPRIHISPVTRGPSSKSGLNVIKFDGRRPRDDEIHDGSGAKYFVAVSSKNKYPRACAKISEKYFKTRLSLRCCRKCFLNFYGKLGEKKSSGNYIIM